MQFFMNVTFEAGQLRTEAEHSVRWRFLECDGMNWHCGQPPSIQRCSLVWGGSQQTCPPPPVNLQSSSLPAPPAVFLILLIRRTCCKCTLPFKGGRIKGCFCLMVESAAAFMRIKPTLIAIIMGKLLA